MQNKAHIRSSSELFMRFGPTLVVALLTALFITVDWLRWGLVFTVPLLLLAADSVSVLLLAAEAESSGRLSCTGGADAADVISKKKKSVNAMPQNSQPGPTNTSLSPCRPTTPQRSNIYFSRRRGFTPKKSKKINAKKMYIFECMFLLILDRFGFPKCLPNPTFSQPFLKTSIL